MSDNPVIQLKNISFSYSGSAFFDNVNLSVAEGELTYIVGPNGGGKTTLLRLILGLLQPTSGEVLLFGRPPAETRHRIGYSPQNLSYDPRFPMTVLDIVLMGRLRFGKGGFYSKRDKVAALSALEMVGIADIAGQLFSEQSGGQRQRALIARALAGDPDLLLLDEPTANVDIEAEAKMLDIIRELNQRMTIIMVSHDLSFVSDIVKSVICVNRKVVVHPTSAITTDAIRILYEDDMRIIRHDLSCKAE